MTRHAGYGTGVYHHWYWKIECKYSLVLLDTWGCHKGSMGWFQWRTEILELCKLDFGTHLLHFFRYGYIYVLTCCWHFYFRFLLLLLLLFGTEICFRQVVIFGLPFMIMSDILLPTLLLTITWCGYDVPAIILFRDLKETVRLDRSKDMSAHVLTCTNYNFNALAPVAWKFWCWQTCVFLHLVGKMSDRFLEQWINIKFFVKLGNNATDSFAMLSEAYGYEAVKSPSVFEWYKRFKDSSHAEITHEDNAHHFLRYQGYCSLWIHSARPVNQAYYAEILKRIREAVRRKIHELWPNDWILHHDNAPARKALSAKQFLTQKDL
jgi:hypothetical protein